VAKTIGRLNAILSVNSASFSTGLRHAAKEVGTFAHETASRMREGSARFKELGLKAAEAFGILDLLSVAGLTEFVHHNLELIDGLAKSADALGFSTEQLQALRLQAKLAGVQQDQLDSSLKRMTRSVQGAADGMPRLVKTFEELGLFAPNLARASAENQLKAIADGLSRIESPSRRAALAMEIFGRDAAGMTNILKDGAAGIQAAQDEAERLGLAISRIDAAKAEVANESLIRLKAVMEGIAETMIIKLSPYITTIVDRFVEWRLAGTGAGGAIETTLRMVALGIAKASDLIMYAQASWLGFKVVGLQVLDAVTWPLRKLSDGLYSFTQIFASYLPDAVVVASAKVHDELKNLGDGLKWTIESDKAQITELLNAPSASEAVTQFFDETGKAAEDEAKRIADAAAKKTNAQQEYNDELKKGLSLLHASSPEDRFAHEPRKKADRRPELKILEAGTAQAQFFIYGQRERTMLDLAEKSLQVQEDMEGTLKQIRDEVADDSLAEIDG
jgi:hypothetical protein